MDTEDESKKKLINECLSEDLENFEIPNIAEDFSKGKLNEVI